MRAEKETLLTSAAQSSTEEMERLLSTVSSVTAERDQLKMDLQENVQMVSDCIPFKKVKNLLTKDVTIPKLKVQ